MTFHLIVFGWILFRSQSLQLTGEFLGGFADWGAATLWTWPVVLGIVVVIGLQLLPSNSVEGFQVRLERLRPAILATGLAVVVVIVGSTVSSEGVAPFIYFRF